MAIYEGRGKITLRLNPTTVVGNFFGIIFLGSGLAALAYCMLVTTGFRLGQVGLGLISLGCLFTIAGAGLLRYTALSHKTIPQKNYRANKPSATRPRIAKAKKTPKTVVEPTPDLPWTKHPQWSTGSVTHGSYGGIIAGFGIAFILLVPVSFLLFNLLSEALREGEYIALLNLIWPALGLFFLVKCAQAKYQFDKYGVLTLKLKTNPAWLGQPFEAEFIVAKGKFTASSVSLALICLEERSSSEGSEYRPVWRKNWSIDATQVTHSQNGFSFPVSIMLPAEIPHSSFHKNRKKPDERTEWRLEIKTEDAQSLDFDCHFSVPIFNPANYPGQMLLLPSQPAGPSPAKADEQNAAQSHAAPSIAAAEELFTEPETIKKAEQISLRVIKNDTKLSLEFPRMRDPGSALFFLLFLLGSAGLAAYMWINGAATLGFILSVVSAAIGYAFLNVALFQSTIHASRGRLTLESGWFWDSTKPFDIKDISHIAVRDGMTSNNDIYYRLMLHLNNTTTIKLAAGIPDRDLAMSLAALLEAQIGLTNKTPATP